jgi:hypothetical protein
MLSVQGSGGALALGAPDIGANGLVQHPYHYLGFKERLGKTI